LANRATAGNVDKEEVLKSIHGMIGRVENLKRKVGHFSTNCAFDVSYCEIQLSDLQETAGKPTQDVMRERLRHLATIETLPTSTGPEFTRWADTRLDRWLVDWSLRNGKEKTARAIAKERGIEVCNWDLRLNDMLTTHVLS
jgi:macrophage erythroblast attacher